MTPLPNAGISGDRAAARQRSRRAEDLDPLLGGLRRELAEVPEQAVGRIKHVGIGDLGGPREVDHDSRAAWHHEAVAEFLDQPASSAAGTGGKREIDLGNVDHHPIGIGESKGAEWIARSGRARTRRAPEMMS